VGFRLIYMDSPVDEAERMRLIQQLRFQITTPLGKQLVFDALDDLVAADGRVSDEERRVVDEVKSAIEAGNSAALARCRDCSRAAAHRRQPPCWAQPRGLSGRLHPESRLLRDSPAHRSGPRGPKLSDAEIRKLSLAGGMMTVVARANPQVTDQEQAAMMATLQQNWRLSDEQAGFLVEVAVSQQPADLDSFRLADGFAAVSDYDERGQLVDALFAIAAADGAVNNDEIETIRGLANAMVLTHERFIEAKLKATRPQG
jgi:uncharacterized tellurite resistance protein B-like protein